MTYEIQTSLIEWGFQSYFELWGNYFPPSEPRDNSIQKTLNKWIK